MPLPFRTFSLSPRREGQGERENWANFQLSRILKLLYHLYEFTGLMDSPGNSYLQTQKNGSSHKQEVKDYKT